VDRSVSPKNILSPTAFHDSVFGMPLGVKAELL
jgi:hypothetical protein